MKFFQEYANEFSIVMTEMGVNRSKIRRTNIYLLRAASFSYLWCLLISSSRLFWSSSSFRTLSSATSISLDKVKPLEVTFDFNSPSAWSVWWSFEIISPIVSGSILIGSFFAAGDPSRSSIIPEQFDSNNNIFCNVLGSTCFFDLPSI